ncbi:MAG: hypothetical protein M1831_005634 [Alyxoria varia]|nr:MAG: hypothetical protein M1831_005634 [Alyxoria varia]
MATIGARGASTVARYTTQNATSLTAGDAIGAGDSELLIPTWEDVEAELVQNQMSNGQGTPNREHQRLEDTMSGGVQDAGKDLDKTPSERSHGMFHAIRREVQWQTMYHASGEVPRLVCAQGETEEFSESLRSPTNSTTGIPSISADTTHETSRMTGHPLYRHPSDQSLSLHAYTPTVDLVRRKVEKTINQPLNHCLIQLYRSGQDFISEHSDKTLDIERGSRIVNVSLGAQRTMRLRTKRPPKDTARADGGSIDWSPAPSSGPQRTTQLVPLPHGSVFILGPRTNSRFLHGINPDRRRQQERSPEETATWCAGERISLTFRSVKTWTDKDELWIWGQGARGCKDRGGSRTWRETTLQEAGRTVNGDERETTRLIDMFGRENQSVEVVFDWEGVYGQDLTGATYWEFLPPSTTKPRRIVQYPRHLRAHLSDVNLSPAWLQWLRHTRPSPPSVQEQRDDVMRMERTRMLAERADERWKDKERLSDDPRLEQNVPSLRTGGDTRGMVLDGEGTTKAESAGKEREGVTEKGKEKDKKEDPWKKHARGPAEEWQPNSWTPGKVEKR